MEPENQEGLDPNAQEPSAKAKQNVSGAGEAGSLSEQGKQDAVTRQEFDSLMSELRGLQGKMDKDANKIEKRLDDKFKERMELLGVELTPEQNRELRLMELADRVEGLYTEQEVTPAKAKPKATVDVDEVFKTLGIDEPTEDDLRLAIQHAGNPVKLAYEIAKNNLQKPTPSSSSAVVPGNAGSPKAHDSDALFQEFNSLKGLHQESLLASGKTVRQRRAEIAQELEELEP